jgi:hypothetical protein
MPTEVEKDIYRVIVYFSYFGYPVTAFEIQKWQFRPKRVLTLREVMQTLSLSEWLMARIENKDGFYGISTKSHGGISRQVALRHDRFLNAVQKYKRLKWVVNYLGRLTCVEGIAICNTLAFHHTRERSDIDLFIIAKPGKIWSARFLSVLPFLLLRKRPGEVYRNPVDLSFFVTRSSMDLVSLKCADDDPYLATWTRSLIPVYGESVFEDFFQNNVWAQSEMPASTTVMRCVAYRIVLNLKCSFIYIPERLAEFLQRKKFPKEINERANKNTDVIVSNDVLKFHKNDRRQEIRTYINKRMSICKD